MALRPSQIIAALSIGVLFAAGSWAAVNRDVASDRQARVDRTAQTLQIGLERVARRAEAAGATAAGAYRDGESFDRSARRLASVGDSAARLSHGLHVAAVGVADFIERNGALSLRRARPLATAGAADDSSALRQSARAAAALISEQLPSGGLLARLAASAPADGAPRFWLIWPAGETGVAFGTLFEVSGVEGAAASVGAEDRWRISFAFAHGVGGDPVRAETPTQAPLPEQIASIAADLMAAASAREVEGRARAAIGDGHMAIDVVSPAHGFTRSDIEAAAPTLTIAFCLLLALCVYVRAERITARRKSAELRATLEATESARRQLDDSRKRFQHLAESTNVVPWEADLDQQRFTYIGPQIEDLCGYPAETWRASGFWVQHIHPGDRRHVLVDTLRQVTEGEFARVHYRVRAADGGIRHVRNMLSIETETIGEGAEARQRRRAQGFLLDVTELHDASAAMARAKQEAEDANRVKSEFLASMSHELRTPLNAIIGFSEIMKDELFGPLDGKYREYSESVHTSGRHLLELINDVLDLSKIEAGRIELMEEETDVAGLLSDCRALLHERISRAGLHDKVDVDEHLPLFWMDERRIKQVLLNLLSNAIKFTPPGGTISLRAEIHKSRGLLIAVRDTGIGMTKEEIPRALSKFGQIDGDLARKHDGTGLGLPIAKSLVEMHQGAFEIASEKGVGTEMRIWLPLTRMIRGKAA